MPSAATIGQLRVISELAGQLERAGIAWWLFGGWAMDFHAGRVTRDHDDIELFVEVDSAERLLELMHGTGFSAPSALHPDEGQPYLRDGLEVGVWYLERQGNERRLRGRWTGWALPPGSFSAGMARLDDVEAPVVSLECLREMKAGFAAQEHGAALRPKDIADLALIDTLIASRDS